MKDAWGKTRVWQKDERRREHVYMLGNDTLFAWIILRLSRDCQEAKASSPSVQNKRN